MEPCFEYLGCDKNDCIMHAWKDAQLCWEIEGTLCSHNGIQIMRDKLEGKKEDACNRFGCIHLCVAIELKAKNTYTEEQFLQKTLNLAIEFGSWLINTSTLEDSIEKGKYHKIDSTYFIEVDAMTVFSASYDNHGKINVDFYIN